MYSERIILTGTENTRSLSNLINKNGYSIKNNLLIRSDALNKIKSEDINILKNKYNLSKVIDLRTDAEAFNKPDVDVPNAIYLHNPILSSDKIGISKKGEKEDFDAFVRLLQDRGIDSSINYMVRTYRTLIDNDFAKKGYGSFLNELIKPCEGSILWHCSAGKDRCGFATILVLYILDFDWDVIVEDYLGTNYYYQNKIERMVNKFGEEYRLILECLFGVNKAYIDTLLEAIKHEYGNMDNYIINGLGFDLEKQMILKDIYLTK